MKKLFAQWPQPVASQRPTLPEKYRDAYVAYGQRKWVGARKTFATRADWEESIRYKGTFTL